MSTFRCQWCDKQISNMFLHRCPGLGEQKREQQAPYTPPNPRAMGELARAVEAERKHAQQDEMARQETSQLISDRQKTHGDFRDNGQIMQALKDLVRGAKNWTRLRPYQREGLDMIEHKIGRIMSGDPDIVDHWDDIAGYATRVATILREDGLAK